MSQARDSQPTEIPIRSRGPQETILAPSGTQKIQIKLFDRIQSVAGSNKASDGYNEDSICSTLGFSHGKHLSSPNGQVPDCLPIHGVEGEGGDISSRLAEIDDRKLQYTKCNDGMPLSLSPDSPPKTFERRVSELPSELCKMVMDMLFEDIFGPKKVDPERDVSVMGLFLALNRSLYQRYRKAYWSQSTWVIGRGPASQSMRFMTQAPFSNSTTEFSLQKPNEAALNIQRVNISFSQEDLRLPQLSRVNEIKACQYVNDLDIAKGDSSTQKHKTDIKTFTSSLKQIWQDKFDRIAFLDLEYLVLDFTKAYSPDGSFLGVEAVQRFLPFIYRTPREMRIVAPTKVFEDEIRKVIQALNQPALISKVVLVGDSG